MGSDLSHYESARFMAPASTSERAAAVISHGSMLLAMPFIVPVIVLVVYPIAFEPSRFVRHTAVQALLFQLLITITGGTLLGIAGTLFAFPAVFPPLALVAWPLALVFGLLGLPIVLWGLIIEVIATWKAFMGESYRMPIVGRIGE